MSRRYHGTPGHFIGARQCCFRLHTTVNGKHRVSTVGCYHPLSQAETDEPVNIGHNRLYETYVFELGEDGVPVSWTEIDSAGYNAEIDAENGHEAMCQKYEQEGAQ